MEYLKKLFDLENKVIVITGGGGILASSMAEGFLNVGAKVVLLDLYKESAEATAAQLKNDNNNIIGLGCDVLSESNIKSVEEIILNKFSRIDVLINAAGGNMPGATIGVDQSVFDLNYEDFKKVTDLNLNGTVLPTLVLGKGMAEQKKGSIINISSMASFRTITRVVGYSAAKAAIDNFTKWMAVELASKYGDNLRVNAIAPGFLLTNQNRSLLTNEDGSLTERGNDIIKITPFKRFGEPEELVGTILWLAGNASKFVTGAVIPIDGGFNVFSGV